MALLNLFLFVLAITLLFGIPGSLITRLVAPAWATRAPVATALATGFGLVCYLSFLAVALLGLAWPIVLTPALLAATAALLTVGAATALRFGRGIALAELLRPAPVFRRPDLPLLALATLVFCGYLLGYDSALFDQERCISRACMLPVRNYLSPHFPYLFDGCRDCFTGRNAFLLWNGGQRLGPSVFVAPFVTLFGVPGFRLLHAFSGLLAGLFGYHLAADTFGHRYYGLAGATLITLAPLALGVPLVDENVLCLALGTVLFAFLLGRQPSWLLGGLFAGLFLGTRHVGLLSLPALFWIAWARRDGLATRPAWVRTLFGNGRGGSIAILTLALFAGSLPWLFVHGRALALGQPLYESFLALPPTTHSFLGITFSLHGLLSWPFAPLVRSPYNGLPTLLSVPILLSHTTGLTGFALILIGWQRGWRRHRIAFLAGLLWLPVQLALLMTMANWVEPNKSGVFLSFWQPIVLAVLAGAAALLQAWRNDRLQKPALILAATLLALGGLILATPRTSLPLDTRQEAARGHYITDVYPVTPPLLTGAEADYAQADRDRLGKPAILPRWRPAPPADWPRRLRQLWLDLSHPGRDDYCPRPKDIIHTLSGIPGPTGQTQPLATMMHHPIGPPDLAAAPTHCTADWGDAELTTVTVDLQTPLPGADGWLRFAPAQQGLPRPEKRILVSPDLPISWNPTAPVHAAVIPAPDRSLCVMLWYGPYRFDHLAQRTDVLTVTAPNGSLHFLAPRGTRLRIVDISSLVPNRFHAWTATIGNDDSLRGPQPTSY